MKCTVAAVQVGSDAFEFESCLDIFERYLREAVDEHGARLVVFPEAFFSAYPRHLSFRIGSRSDEDREWYARYVQSSVLLPDGIVGTPYGQAELDTERHKNYIALAKTIHDTCFDGEALVSVGIVERSSVGSTLYCTNLLFAPDGTLLSRHRKLQPTGAERIIWSQTGAQTDDGPGRKIDNMPVVDTELGKIGGLICWENYQPLWRFALYKKGVEIYTAPTADGRPTWAPSMQHIAQEGRCFVVSANQFHDRSTFPADYPASGPASEDEIWSRGGSCIIDPLGRILAGPLWDKDGIVTAEIDTGLIDGYKLDFDVVGHYARDDIFEFNVKA